MSALAGADTDSFTRLRAACLSALSSGDLALEEKITPLMIMTPHESPSTGSRLQTAHARSVQSGTGQGELFGKGHDWMRSFHCSLLPVCGIRSVSAPETKPVLEWLILHKYRRRYRSGKRAGEFSRVRRVCNADSHVTVAVPTSSQFRRYSRLLRASVTRPLELGHFDCILCDRWSAHSPLSPLLRPIS